MRRYLETLFSFQELFLIPIIFTPIITLFFAVQVGRQYEIESAMWVDSGWFADPLRGSQVSPSETEGQTIREWLSTETFRTEIIERIGLQAAINEGRWPVPSRLEMELARIPVVGSIARGVGFAPPATREEAQNRALEMVKRSISVTPDGYYLLRITYAGHEPNVGERLLQEIILLYNEKTIDRQVAEGRTAVDFYTRQATIQRERLDASAEALKQFLIVSPEPPIGASRPAVEAAQLEDLRRAYALESALYESTLRKLEEVRITGEGAISNRTASFRVIDAPQLPEIREGLKKKAVMIAAIGGLGAGLFLWLMPVVLLTWLDTTVRSRRDIENVVGETLIARVPIVSISTDPKQSLVRRAMVWQLTRGIKG